MTEAARKCSTPRVSRLALFALALTALFGSPAALAQSGARLLVLDLQQRGAVSDEEAETARTLVTDALRGREGLLVATSEDVYRRAPLEADRAATCESELCLHELADALDADFVLFGHIDESAEGRVVHLGLFEEKSGEIIEREEVSAADLVSLAPFLGGAMDRLLEPVLTASAPNAFEQPLFLAGAGIAAAGALLAVGAGGYALELELSLGQGERRREVKERALSQGPLLLAFTGAGTAVAVVGAALLGTSFLLEP